MTGVAASAKGLEQQTAVHNVALKSVMTDRAEAGPASRHAWARCGPFGNALSAYLCPPGHHVRHSALQRVVQR
jgi:hypothetical protein